MPSYVNVFPFVGGGNYTGASIGALESSPSHYLVAGNSQEQVMNSDNIVRNIFVTATSKSDFSNSGSGDVDFNSYQKVIDYILKNGAEEGVHVVLQIDKPSQLLFSDYMSGKIFTSMFHHAVMLRSDAGAVNSLGMSDDLKLENLSSDIERLRAIYYNEANDSYTLFSPFDF